MEPAPPHSPARVVLFDTEEEDRAYLEHRLPNVDLAVSAEPLSVRTADVARAAGVVWTQRAGVAATVPTYR